MGWYGLYAAIKSIDAATRAADHAGIEAAARRFVSEYGYLANPNTPAAALEIALEEFIARYHRLPLIGRGTRGSMGWRASTIITAHGGVDTCDTSHLDGCSDDDEGVGKHG